MIFSPKHNINFTLDPNATVFKPDLKPQIEYKSNLILKNYGLNPNAKPFDPIEFIPSGKATPNHKD